MTDSNKDMPKCVRRLIESILHDCDKEEILRIWDEAREKYPFAFEELKRG